MTELLNYQEEDYTSCRQTSRINKCYNCEPKEHLQELHKDWSNPEKGNYSKMLGSLEQLKAVFKLDREEIVKQLLYVRIPTLHM